MTYGFTIQEAVHPTVMPPPPQPPPGNTNAMPPLTALPRPSANGHQIPPDADSQGFVGYPGARCNYTNPAVVMGRTADSVVVICQTGVGRFYYLVPALVSDFADFRLSGLQFWWSCRESNPIAPLRAWLDVDPVVETVFSCPAGVPSAGRNHGVDESSRFCLPLCVDRSPTMDCGGSAAEQPSDAVGQPHALGLGCNTVGGNRPAAVIGDDRSSEATGVPAGSALSALHAVDLLVVILAFNWTLVEVDGVGIAAS
jgi:hypothetical protein